MRTHKHYYQQVANAMINASPHSLEELSRKSREVRFFVVRQAIFYVLMEKKLCTNIAAGEMFNRDHVTVIYSLKKIKNLLDTKYPLHDYNLVTSLIEIGNNVIDKNIIG